MLFGIKLGFLSFSFILYSRKVAWCSGSISRPCLYKSQQLVFLRPVGFRNLPRYVHFILIICSLFVGHYENYLVTSNCATPMKPICLFIYFFVFIIIHLIFIYIIVFKQLLI